MLRDRGLSIDGCLPLAIRQHLDQVAQLGTGLRRLAPLGQDLVAGKVGVYGHVCALKNGCSRRFVREPSVRDGQRDGTRQIAFGLATILAGAAQDVTLFTGVHDEH